MPVTISLLADRVPYKKRQITTLFADYAKKAGIKGRSIHSLRHSIAVHLLEAARALSAWLTTSATRIFRTPTFTRKSLPVCAKRSLPSWSAIPRLLEWRNIPPFYCHTVKSDRSTFGHCWKHAGG